MKLDGNRSAENAAWEVVRDPSASEKHWMAACTLLEGKLPPSIKKNRKLPSIVGLPWSLSVSALSSIGAVLIFSFVEYYIDSAIGSSINVFAGPHSFALLGCLFITFSSVFAYQQHAWGGGRFWSAVYFGIVGFLACVPFSSTLNFGAFPSEIIAPLCIATLFGTSLLTTKMTRGSIKRLEGSIGANRVMSHSRNIFFGTGLLCLAMRVLSVSSDLATLTVLAWIPIVLLGSGYYITKTNKVTDPQSASTLAFAAFTPLILTNVLLLGALAVNSGLALFSLVPQVSINSYWVGIGTMLCLIVGPLLGATTASRSLQRARALELHNFPVELINQVSTAKASEGAVDEPELTAETAPTV